jgi:hypothetical protein
VARSLTERQADGVGLGWRAEVASVGEGGSV